MFDKGFYYRVNALGKRCENIKEVNPFFLNYPGQIEEMEKEGLSEDERLAKAAEWLWECTKLELSVKGFEWYLLQEGYHYAGELFDRIGRMEDSLYCAGKEFECGFGLLPFFENKKDAKRSFSAQVELGRRLVKRYQEKEDWNKAFYYTNVTMDYLISAKGTVSEEEIDELFKLVLEDRQEISEKMKK
ncbi:MAG: hypothetical protein IJY10_10925 [Lachnospiraceae bacterium]|nr:hypothetical protein [Lachnospiraceae bacterium]